MNAIKKYLSLLAAGLLSAAAASAAIEIPTVFVGDAGNPGDPFTDGQNYNQTPGGFGQVNYDYYIGTYEVTNAQYASFLNSVAASDPFGLYNINMAGSLGGITRSGISSSFTYTATKPNHPVNYVSFWDAARFTNWLTTGDTEKGVYMLNATGIANNTITRDATAWANGGVAIASENEWYKAAYYSGSPTGADGDGYWLYPTQSNSITTEDANYYSGNTTAVGSYTDDASYYGTFDQGGNVWEWNDEILFHGRGLRGGDGFDEENGIRLRHILQSFNRSSAYADDENYTIGFRVSSLAAIPEPAALGGLFGLAALLVARRRVA